MSNEQDDDESKDLTSEEVDQLASNFRNSQPRPHHYVLAHIALRSLALENPLRFLGVMGSPDADNFLDSVYQSLIENLKENGPPDFTMGDVRYERGKLGDWLCIAFIMPPPKEVTEAYFCCLTGYLDPSDPNPSIDSVQGRWFTLEHGLLQDGGTRTVLCEWTKDSTHKNYGDGPEPTLDNFLQAVANIVIPTTSGKGGNGLTQDN